MTDLGLIESHHLKIAVRLYHLVCFCHWIISKALEQWIYQCTIHQVQDTNLKLRNSSPPFPCGRQNSKEIRYGCGQKRIKNMVVDMILPLVLFLFMAKHTTLQERAIFLWDVLLHRIDFYFSFITAKCSPLLTAWERKTYTGIYFRLLVNCEVPLFPFFQSFQNQIFCTVKSFAPFVIIIIIFCFS